jgi:hypothetical protein
VVSYEAFCFLRGILVVRADKIYLADDVACQIKMEGEVMLHWAPPQTLIYFSSQTSLLQRKPRMEN